ncbi:MAG: hypothetical protein IPM24_18955 [Bryobacterales bacterium]|nr:hypothetical protein [Bryobacterales bacterium]
MQGDWTIYVVIWAVTAGVVGLLAGYRKLLSLKEDDTLHLAEGQVGTVAEQKQLAGRLEQIDKWGKILTAISLIYGVVLAIAYLVAALNDQSRLMMK